MNIKATLKKIFLRPKKEPEPVITCLEDLFEPEVSVLGIVDPQFGVTSPAPVPEIIVPKVVIPKTTIMDKLRALAPFVFFREKKVVLETGLTTRQRVKRYNASMEGGHGRPEGAGKK